MSDRSLRHLPRYLIEMQRDSFWRLATSPLRSLGAFSTGICAEWKSADILAALPEDYTLRVSRQSRSQYWLRSPDGPDENTGYSVTSFYTAEDDESPPRIEVIFLLP